MKDRRRHIKCNSFAPTFGGLESRRLMASGTSMPTLAAVVSPMPAVRAPFAAASVNAVRAVTFNSVRGLPMPAGSAMPLSNVIIQRLDVSTTLDGSLTIEFGKPMNPGSTAMLPASGKSKADGNFADSILNVTQADGDFHGPSMQDFLGGTVRIEAARTPGLPPIMRLGWIGTLMGSSAETRANSPLGFLLDAPDYAMAEPWTVVSAAKSHDDATATASRSVDETFGMTNFVCVQSPSHESAGQDPAGASADGVSQWDGNSQSFAIVSAESVGPASRLRRPERSVARSEHRAVEAVLNSTGSDVPTSEPSDNWIAIADAFGLDASLPDFFVNEPLDESVEENGTALTAAIDRILSEYPGTEIEQVEEAKIGRTLGIAAGVLIVVEAVRRRRQAESGRAGPELPDDEVPTTEFDLRDARIE